MCGTAGNLTIRRQFHTFNPYCMKRLWLAKIFIALGVLSFVAKPFYGFAMIARHYHPAETSILVKVFSKRGPDFQEDTGFSLSDFDKKPPQPGFKLVPCASGFPHYIFVPRNIPAAINTAFLKERKRRLSGPAPAWLLNSQFII